MYVKNLLVLGDEQMSISDGHVLYEKRRANEQLSLDHKTMKNEGFRPSIYGSYPLKMKVLGSHGGWDLSDLLKPTSM